MPAEIDRELQKAQLRIDRELARIWVKYYSGVDRTSGLQDALDYASLKLEVWRLRVVDKPPEAFEPEWAEAEKEAERVEGSPAKLRELLRRDANEMIEIGKSGLVYEVDTRVVQALFNLANSI